MLTIHKWLRTDMGGNDGDISSSEGAIAVTRAGNCGGLFPMPLESLTDTSRASPCQDRKS